MNRKPLTQKTGAQVMRRMPADIPITSPYYDRIRALNDQICFVSESSPDYEYLVLQIAEMEDRAMRRLYDDKRFGIKQNQ